MNIYGIEIRYDPTPKPVSLHIQWLEARYRDAQIETDKILNKIKESA